ncbi:Uncharacterised protein [Mycobacteroides abscessus subsp. abscessus]|nr:Uncharacterised protein [Mycobacteroides abscessus subsp. abscessus]
MTFSEMVRAYSSEISALRLMNRPWRQGTHLLGCTGSKIMVIPR